MDMAPPRNVKEVQRLTGRMGALKRFLSRSAVRGLHFFRILKAPKDFQWIEECQKAFADLKAYLAELPTLTAPEQGETLFLYLSACNEAVSAVLVREHRGLRGQFITSAELYKGRKPLRQILTKLEVSGRMTKWAVELAEHDISYQPRTAIKAQALADFLAEGASLTITLPISSPTKGRSGEPWVLFVDGASSKEGSGAGLLLTSPTGEELTYALRCDFPTSNNETEYETLLIGLRIAHRMGITAIKVRSDSQLDVLQVRGEYEAKEDVMKKYLFDIFEIDRVPRSQNKRADALSKLASSSFAHLSNEVLVEVVKRKSID
ncbi:uncharacterized protein [Coffea arabica]|uniref:RNase H type-1 domain-containing protein n=1 Tax=Coffea arabica TaxID=13443 RepID=A0ABM4UR02_COFAR